VPTVNVMLYTTASLGGYGEALLSGSLVVYCTLRIINRFYRNDSNRLGWVSWLIWGGLSGLGMWANGLSLVFSAPAGLTLLFFILRNRAKVSLARWIRVVGAAVAGFLIGSAPWWIFAITQGFSQLVFELLGSAVAVEQTPWLVRTWDHLISFVLLGGSVMFGFRPPWDIQWLGLPLLPFILIFWVFALIVWFRRSSWLPQQRWGWMLLNGCMATLTAGFILTSFGVDPSGRYFLPFVLPFSLMAALAIMQLKVNFVWKAALVGLLLVYQGWGTLQCALLNPPGITTQFSAITQVDIRYQQSLIDFLKNQGETRGYSNYWVAYPTAFLSNEELIFLPRLPYHEDLRYTPRDDRYAPYQSLLASANRAAYITTRNAVLDQRLVEGFRKLGVTWQENQIGDYHIFFRLSRLVRPDELNLEPVP
jgi:4-amino-4-deoxy-L-arabinose transferase-like glycosyltransferase